MCSGPCHQAYPITHFWSDAGSADGTMSRCPTCEKSARAQRAAAKASGAIEGGTVQSNGRVVHYSDEERKRRSEMAKKLHADGRLGGAANGSLGGKAIHRHRINDAVLEHFRQPEKQELVIKAYETSLKGKNKPLRLRAAESLLRNEAQQDERMARERGGAVDPAGMSQEELTEFVAQGIEAMLARGEIPADIVLNGDDVQEIS